MMSVETPSKTPAKRKSCLWLGLKWTFLLAVLLLVTLVIFHRPVLRFALDRGGRYFANKAGLAVDWQLGGSVVSALGLEGVRVSGDRGPVRKVELKHLALEYDVPALWGVGLSGLVGKVELHDANVELDLRGGATKEPKVAKAAGEKKGPPDIWVGKLDLQRVNARIQTDSGEILVRGLTLQLIQGEVGNLVIEELVIPSAKLHLTQVAGKTEVHGRSIVLKEVAVKPGVRIESLVANLRGLAEGKLPVGLDLTSGEGRLWVAGELWLGEKFGLEAKLALRNLTEADVAPWAPLPTGLHWRADHGALEARGYPAEPQGLEFKLALEGSALEVAGQKVEKVALMAESKSGQLKVEELLAEVTGNYVEVKGDAALPVRWADMKLVDTALDWRLEAPEVAKLKPDLKVGGSVSGSGKVVLKQGQLSAAQADLWAAPLYLPNLPVSFLQTKVNTNGSLLMVESLRWSLDDKHQVNVDGTLELAGEQKVTVNWRIDFPEAGKWVPEQVASKMGAPVRAALYGGGKASFALPDLKARDWSRVAAETRVELFEVQWGEAALKRVDLLANVAGGQLELRKLEAIFDEVNRMEVKGTAAVDMKGPFDVAAVADLKELPRLGGWLKMAKAPALGAGALSVNWKASGMLDRSQLRGGGRVALQGGKLAARNEMLELLLEAQHEGMNAEVSKLEASAGPWRASGSMKLSPELLSIPGLTLQSGDLKLLDVNAEVPLVLNQQPRPAVPLDMRKEWRVAVKMDRLKVGELFERVGVKALVKGQIDGHLLVDGTPENPKIDLDLNLSEVTAEAVAGKLVPAKLQVQANLENDQFTLLSLLDQPPLKTLRVEGKLPLKLEEVLKNQQELLETPLEARVSLPSSDIAVARKFAPMLSALEGKVMADVKVEGRLNDPKWAGQLRVDVTAAAVDNVPMDLKDVKLHLGFEQMLVKLEDVSAAIAGGSVRLGGQVNLAKPADPEFDLQLEAKEALLMRDQTMSLRTDGRVTCQGTLSKATVAGRLELVRGRVFKEIEFLPLSLPNQLPPPPPSVKRSTQKLVLPPLLKDWTFDLAVKTRDPIRLLGNVLNGGVVVDLTAKGTGAAPELEGKVVLDKARLQLPFSRLNITRGEVIFNKDQPFDPQLDLQGDSFVNNYQVTLYAYGSALEPKLRFTSSPPLSEGDIATLLATGATGGDLRSSEGLAASRAASLLFSQTYRKLFRKAAPRRYDEEPPKLSFNFSALGTGGSERAVSATYEISPNLQAVGTIAENGSFRGLFYYLVRFR